MLTAGRRLSAGGGERAWGGRSGKRTVVDETHNALGGQRIGVLMGVDGVVGPRITANRVQRSAGVAGHHLDMAVEQHPVARLGCVAIAQRVPAVVCLRVLLDRDDAQRRRVRADPDIGPLMEWPRVGGAAGDPTLLAHHLSSQFQRQAGKGRAGCAVVGAVQAGSLPDDGLHLGRRLALSHLEVVGGDVDDGRAQRRVTRARLPDRVLKGQQVDRNAGRRPHIGGHLGYEGESRYRPARAKAHQCGSLLPPGLARGLHRITSPLGTLRPVLPKIFGGWLRATALTASAA
jgi:hypothetical protein